LYGGSYRYSLWIDCVIVSVLYRIFRLKCHFYFVSCELCRGSFDWHGVFRMGEIHRAQPRWQVYGLNELSP
jgi:hypothetical protein